MTLVVETIKRNAKGFRYLFNKVSHIGYAKMEGTEISQSTYDGAHG